MIASIRDARLPDERSRLADYIHKSQLFEAVFESNRRTDKEIAPLYLDALLRKVETAQGRVFVAEETGSGVVIGWAACHTSEQPVFVKEEERRFGYIAELFVEEAHRGRYVGRQLIEACEAHFRALGLAIAMIGVLAGNTRAHAAYVSAGYAPYATDLHKRL